MSPSAGVCRKIEKSISIYFGSIAAVIPVLVGRDTFREVMALAVESLQHKELNRHLLYYLLDIATDALTIG